MKILLLGGYLDPALVEPHSVVAPLMHYGSPKDKGGGPKLPDVADYDVIVVDLTRVDDTDTRVLLNTSGQIAERVATGGVLLCFVDTPRAVMVSGDSRPQANFGWLPVTTGPRARTGEDYTIVCDAPYAPLLQRYLHGIKWVCDLDATVAACLPLAVSKVGSAIAAQYQYGSGPIFLLPRVDKWDEFLGRFVKEVLPLIAPDMFSAGHVEQSPPWLESWLDRIPGRQDLDTEILNLEQQIEELQASRRGKILQKEGLERWGDLLWQTGVDPLEERVREALRLFRLDAQTKHGVDVVVDCDNGILYAEVEGTTKGIQVDKARKLLEDIANADSPGQVRGAIIGNPFRLENPDSRPPGQAKLFVREVEDAAKKFGWALITTRELFDLVCRHLAGDTAAAQELRNRLFPDSV